MSQKKLTQGMFKDILEEIIDGDTLRTIAKKRSCSVSTLHTFISKPEHSARTREALTISAATYADKGEEVLIEAKGTRDEIARARELAQHYRWKASKRNPRQFGDKLDVTTDGDKLNKPQLDLSKLSSEEIQTYLIISDKASTQGGTV